MVEVIKGSPAESAGLRPGDIIIEVDGSPVESPRDLQRLMVDGPIERFLVIRVLRPGSSYVVTAIPDELAAASGIRRDPARAACRIPAVDQPSRRSGRRR